MSKINYRDIEPKERRKMIRDLSRLLLSVENERDMIQLLYRLFTPSEIVMIGRRMQIGELMINGWSYRSIQEKLRVGIGTIRSVDRWLEDIMRDYAEFRRQQQETRKAAKRHSQAREWAELGSFTHIRRKYPLHFLLVNLLLDAPLKSSESTSPTKQTKRKKY